MVLSVPLTTTIKVALSNSKSTQWFSILLEAPKAQEFLNCIIYFLIMYGVDLVETELKKHNIVRVFTHCSGQVSLFLIGCNKISTRIIDSRFEST